MSKHSLRANGIALSVLWKQIERANGEGKATAAAQTTACDNSYKKYVQEMNSHAECASEASQKQLCAPECLSPSAVANIRESHNYRLLGRRFFSSPSPSPRSCPCAESDFRKLIKLNLQRMNNF